MWKLVSKFLPIGGGWWFSAAIGLLGLSAGAWLGSVVQGRATDQVRVEYAEFRTQVLKSVAAENAQVALALSEQSKNLRRVQEGMAAQRAKDTAFSDNLIKELQNANGKSCPLSPSIVKYLDGLRNGTGAGDN